MENFMNYYKDTNTGEVYAYDDEQVEGGFVKKGLVVMIPAEVEEHKNPKLTLEQASILERQWRDSELSRADIQLNKVQDGMSGLGTVTAWRQYRVDLRNLPETEGFPETSIRPVAPDAL